MTDEQVDNRWVDEKTVLQIAYNNQEFFLIGGCEDANFFNPILHQG